MNYTATDTYDVIPEISPETEVFQQKDVNFIARIKKGYFFDRWTAVISVPRKADKCVFASTVTDHMLRTNDFHWGSYVKQLVELKQHDKLLEIEGLSIAADRLYVLYEHLPGTRLTNHIEETLGEDTRLRYVMDITEGIGFIHSKGFLHPGLSTNKVLLSKGHCRVYDFLLSEDAPKKVALLKYQPGCNHTHLPQSRSKKPMNIHNK
ncbi:hypothetical protein BSL78_10536 [Apostichopus japonicus]|uniref:Protein kinase domain-containing protein n=1 Tax=Stichopus japonicus TaxID=307972 RepID=A0A2G8KX08_STIJA|nr:hypothetical protein BSL78_10536 [Apostichopus japonicus]